MTNTFASEFVGFKMTQGRMSIRPSFYAKGVLLLLQICCGQGRIVMCKEMVDSFGEYLMAWHHFGYVKKFYSS